MPVDLDLVNGILVIVISCFHMGNSQFHKRRDKLELGEGGISCHSPRWFWGAVWPWSCRKTHSFNPGTTAAFVAFLKGVQLVLTHVISSPCVLLKGSNCMKYCKSINLYTLPVTELIHTLRVPNIQMIPLNHSKYKLLEMRASPFRKHVDVCHC